MVKRAGLFAVYCFKDKRYTAKTCLYPIFIERIMPDGGRFNRPLENGEFVKQISVPEH